MKISIIGAGYVGLSLALILSQHNKVTITDKDDKKIQLIKAGQSQIKDYDVKEAFERNHTHLYATSSLKKALLQADYIIIAVSTDFNIVSQQFNVLNVESIVRSAYAVNSNATIVIKSTVPVGFTSDLYRKYNIPSNLLYCPEFLREGKSLHDNFYPSRIIIGIAPENKQNYERASIFANLLKQSALSDSINILFMGYSEAESVKLFSNAYLALRVVFFNELDTFAECKNLSSKNIIEGVCLDSRIGMYYNNPSFGYGGYCLLCQSFSSSSTQSVILDIISLETSNP